MKEKILVVDDEETCLFFLSSCLEEEGYEVRGASDGHEAISTTADFRPDILITDWMLKDGKDGVEVAEELLGSYPEMKVIFITGMSAEAIKSPIKSLTYCAVLEKPIEIEHILRVINQSSTQSPYPG